MFVISPFAAWLTGGISCPRGEGVVGPALVLFSKGQVFSVSPRTRRRESLSFPCLTHESAALVVLWALYWRPAWGLSTGFLPIEGPRDWGLHVEPTFHSQDEPHSVLFRHCWIQFARFWKRILGCMLMSHMLTFPCNACVWFWGQGNASLQNEWARLSAPSEPCILGGVASLTSWWNLPEKPCRPGILFLQCF